MQCITALAGNSLEHRSNPESQQGRALGLLDVTQFAAVLRHLPLPAADHFGLLTLAIDVPAILRLGPKALGLFLVDFVWIAIHAGMMIAVAKAVRAPMFYLAVGSQANIGGAASAPVVIGLSPVARAAAWSGRRS